VATRQHIVVVEDHEALNAMICRVLCKAGHHAHGVYSVEDLQEYPTLVAVDVFVVDWNLPGESGLSFCARLRQMMPQVGIIVITAKTGNENQLEGYASGADFYLSKPVQGAELLRAIDILKHRRQQRADISESVSDMSAILRRDRLKIERGNVEVGLSIRDVKVLVAMSISPNEGIEIWQLAEILEMNFSDESLRAIEVRISRLRKKLATVFGDGNHIPYVRGEGYRLVCRLEIC